MNKERNLMQLKELHAVMTKDNRHYKLIELIIQINEIVKTDTEKYLNEENFIGGLGEDSEGYRLYDQIQNEAAGLFINSKGQASNYSQLATDTNQLLYVRRGEWDSFGWLTGIIHTPYGKLVYG